MSEPEIKNDEFWRSKLSPEEFSVCREHGTERPFTGEYTNHKLDGQYTCRCCGATLFDSHAKFDSGSGWPSFFQGSENSAIQEKLDQGHGMTRTEILCQQCDSHLGHMFTDGPQPTGLRYCVNSLSLSFEGRDKGTGGSSKETDARDKDAK
ncbi:MAG: peptide-methionine (R)-S-oxide reductase [Flavobacteriales bacterium]|jgi:peptide-methionine (R)-S-oxide reductase